MKFSAVFSASASSGLKTETKELELGHEIIFKDFKKEDLICILNYGTKIFYH